MFSSREKFKEKGKKEAEMEVEVGRRRQGGKDLTALRRPFYNSR
jgi:hypothetical protein